MQKFNCAQMVFGHAAQYLDIAEDDAIRIAALFGTGIRRGLTCDAVMALGYKFGNDAPGDEAAKTAITAMGAEFEGRFIAQYDSLLCREILGHDVSTPNGREAVITANLFNTKCPQVIMSACTILDDILQHEQ